MRQFQIKVIVIKIKDNQTTIKDDKDKETPVEGNPNYIKVGYRII
ncbi:MAG: hypothetical protein ACXWMS_08800 [Syntrophales bacterium]